MELLKDLIQKIEKDEISLDKENLLKWLKDIYKHLLMDNIIEEMTKAIETIDTTLNVINLHDLVCKYTWNYIAYPNEEDFYIDNCTGYIDAIERAMDSYHWSSSDEYIDDDFETFDEYEFADKIQESKYSIAKDIVETYLKEEKFREEFKELTFISDYYKNRLQGIYIKYNDEIIK